jgi:hypothetical protein
MKLKKHHGWHAAVWLGLASALQGADTNQVQQLQQQLRLLQESFEKVQQQYRQQFESLQKQIDALQPDRPQPAAPSLAVTSPPPSAVVSTNGPPPVVPTTPVAELKKPWNPAAPITLAGGQKNYLNLSFDGLVAAGGSTFGNIGELEPGAHDPKQNGFTIQNLETVFEGAVDPYFRAQANFVAQIDTVGESTFEVEEAYAETTSLPLNLQVRAGQYLTEFGRINTTHPHTWQFVDVPLVAARILGPEGLRNPGVRVSWLAPTPFYSELFLNIQNSGGTTAYSFGYPDSLYGRPATAQNINSFGDLLLAPRYAVSFDLTDTQTALIGVSGAFGPNSSGQDTGTQIYGADLFWKWKPASQHGGFPFVSWQTEAMGRRYEAGAGDALAAQTYSDYGLYSQVAWGFKQGWVAAFRVDWVGGDPAAYDPITQPGPNTRWRVSPNVTWYPTEYSKIRLQYNYDDQADYGTASSVWLQLEFLLGAHAAHKF